jgi:hypothetical protein
VDIPKPSSDVYETTTALPVPWHDVADMREFGYGFALPFLLFPLSAVSAGVAVIVLLLRGLGAARRPEREDHLTNLLVVGVYVVYTLKTSPAIGSPRNHIQVAAGCAYLIHWLATYVRSARFDEASSCLATLCHAVSLYWAKPGFEVDWSTAKKVAAMPAAVRATQTFSEWKMPSAAIAARDKELTAGTLTLFMDDTVFPSTLWNETFSNQIAYAPREPVDAMLKTFDASTATWVVVRNNSPLHAAMATREHWERVGLVGNDDAAFRRR